jgi:hypothetical protein
MHSLGQQMPCLLVEGDGIAHRYYPHRLIACCQTPTEGWFRQPGGQGMVCQDRRRCSRLQRFQRTTVKDEPSPPPQH